MSQEEFAKKVYEYLSGYFDNRNFTPETTPEDLDMDSIDCAELLVNLEEYFEIEIPDTVEFTNVGELIYTLSYLKGV